MATMQRLDRREHDEIRDINIVYGQLGRADGSATFGFGDTRATASVSGPIEVRPNLEAPSQATLDIHVRPLASAPGTDSKALAAMLKSVLTPALLLSHHPRTLVQIVVQALCGSGTVSELGGVGRGWSSSLVASVVNAASVAFLNAGSIPMRGVVCAVAVGRISNGTAEVPSLVLDPSELEFSQLSGGGCFAFLISSVSPSIATPGSSLPGTSLLWTDYRAANASFDEAELEQARQLALSGVEMVWQRIKNALAGLEINDTSQSLATKASSEAKLELDDVDDAKMEI